MRLEQLFLMLLNLATAIPFDSKWENETEYFDNISKSGISELSKSMDRHGRRILIIPIKTNGNYLDYIVINDRYSEGDDIVFTMNRGSV